MSKFVWNEDKALALRSDSKRGHVGFEECVDALENGKLIADLPNPSASYPHQRIFILDINNYAYVVPYLPDEHEVFLKTVFPSRKYTAIYLKDEADD
jgi:hypothetical protein